MRKVQLTHSASSIAIPIALYRPQIGPPTRNGKKTAEKWILAPPEKRGKMAEKWEHRPFLTLVWANFPIFRPFFPQVGSPIFPFFGHFSPRWGQNPFFGRFFPISSAQGNRDCNSRNRDPETTIFIKITTFWRVEEGRKLRGSCPKTLSFLGNSMTITFGKLCKLYCQKFCCHFGGSYQKLTKELLKHVTCIF